MPDPRGYTTAARAALFAVAGGTCYFPGCTEEVIKHLPSGPEIMADIAHIKGAHPGSPRYDPNMTDTERAAYANVLLLCRAHHNLIDRRDPDAYPVATLMAWKSDRERASGAGDFSALRAVSESDLEELLLDAVRGLAPKRAVEVDLQAVLLAFRGPEMITSPFSLVRSTRETNPNWASRPLHVRANVRNVGVLNAYVKSVDLVFDVRVAPEHNMGTFTRAGMNEFPGLNPRLPMVVEGGNALSWLWTSEPMLQAVARAKATGATIAAMFVLVRFASGEEIESERVPIADVQDAESSVVPDPMDPRYEARRQRLMSQGESPLGTERLGEPGTREGT